MSQVVQRVLKSDICTHVLPEFGVFVFHKKVCQYLPFRSEFKPMEKQIDFHVKVTKGILYIIYTVYTVNKVKFTFYPGP